MTTDRLLREYVRQVLREDGMDFGGGDAMYGMMLGSEEDLYKVFVKPFVDVIDTAAGKTKELSQKGQTLLKVAFEALATTLVPILRDSYAEIFAKEEERIDKIKEKYHDVYQSNWDAFRDNDVVCTAFCYAPVSVLTAGMIEKSPRAAMRLISVLSGGTLDEYLEKVARHFGFDLDKELEPPKTGLDFTGEGPPTTLESLIRERGKPTGKPDLTHVLLNPKLLAKLKQSDVVKQMEADGHEMVMSTLQRVLQQASGVLKAQSLQDLQQKTGTKLKGMDKLAAVPQEQRQQAEQALLTGAKRSMKSFYVGNLESQVKRALESGVPETSPYVQAYRKTIDRIKAL